MNKIHKYSNKPSICFVALNAYNILSGREDLNHIGGAEVQQLRIAKWLFGRGFSVSFVTLDHGQPDGIDIDGIKVYKTYALQSGIRGVRFIHPRWSGLWSAMSRANADIYYQRGSDCQTGQVALWCRLKGRRFIFGVAHDSDCDLDSVVWLRREWTDKIFYRIGIQWADAVIVQTFSQKHAVQNNLGISAEIVRSCCWELESLSSKITKPHKEKSLRVIWIGRFGVSKRFEWLIELAKALPQVVFDVIGSKNSKSEYSQKLTRLALDCPNITMHGFVPYHRIPEMYRQSNILLCTSSYEGFPNTFLEAWSLGIPVVSTFDPDGIISENGLGLVADDIAGLIHCLETMIQSPQQRLSMAKAAKDYCVSHHSIDLCLPEFQQILLNTMNR